MPFASVDSQTPKGHQLNARREGARSRMRPRSILHQNASGLGARAPSGDATNRGRAANMPSKNLSSSYPLLST
ncbi:hypothetical protein F383_03420 [Gossypium arboreum]|uniref:Uncharacterized protein n=1 Tax=Gossypium arboreum TaxID=29729 RepID=A0A0B0NXI2_GOSAR|nr:hypothetical protein F383_03420 [Gossypium arboreum]